MTFGAFFVFVRGMGRKGRRRSTFCVGYGSPSFDQRAAIFIVFDHRRVGFTAGDWHSVEKQSQPLVLGLSRAADQNPENTKHKQDLAETTLVPSGFWSLRRRIHAALWPAASETSKHERSYAFRKKP
jgi:hypothetical protein